MKNSAGLRALAWSPDGKRLAFAMGYGPWTIFVVNADGSGLRRLIANGSNPDWSPDGSRISFDRGFRWGPLMVARADGTNARYYGYGLSGPWDPIERSSPQVRGGTPTPTSL